MSQEIRVKGELTIVPPLTNQEVREHAKLTSPRRDVWVQVTEEDVHVEDFTLIKRSADTVAASPNNFVRGMDNELAEIIAAFPGREFTGWFECSGDGETWRVVVRDGKTYDIYPTLVWPEEPGSER